MKRRVSQVLSGRRRWTLINGDCLTELRKLPDGRVHAVIGDPPYGISYQSKHSRRFNLLANDARPFHWWLFDAQRILADGGVLLCFCRGDVQDVFKDAITHAGLHVRSQVIWDREYHGAGDCASTFAPQHDVIWFATKGRFAFPNGRPRSVLRCPKVSPRELVHPTQKPVRLLRPLVEKVTRPNQLVLDPTAGSGSTGVACLQIGRRFIGIELDPDFAKTARCRMRQAAHQAAS